MRKPRLASVIVFLTLVMVNGVLAGQALKADNPWPVIVLGGFIIGIGCALIYLIEKGGFLLPHSQRNQRSAQLSTPIGPLPPSVNTNVQPNVFSMRYVPLQAQGSSATALSPPSPLPAAHLSTSPTLRRSGSDGLPPYTPFQHRQQADTVLAVPERVFPASHSTSRNSVDGPFSDPAPNSPAKTSGNEEHPSSHEDGANGTSKVPEGEACRLSGERSEAEAAWERAVALERLERGV